MMIKDSKGQISLEYLLIFAISLILLIVFTLPLAEQSIQNTLDVSDTVNMKSDLSQLSQAIETVYGQGQGSKRSINIMANEPNKINIAGSYISCNMKLKDSSNKQIKINCNSNLDKTDIPITKGINTIIVEWPAGSENMKIYKK